MIQKIKVIKPSLNFPNLSGLLGYLFESYTPVFICGISGSGTTLLSGLLDQEYENICCLHESAICAVPDSPLKMQSVSEYRTIQEYRSKCFLSPKIDKSLVRKSLLATYRQYRCKNPNSNVVIDKAPNVHLARTIPLKEAFPDAKFILVYRNPVQSIEGLRRKWPLFGNSQLFEVCSFWKDMHNAFLRDIRGMKSDVFLISYEELISNSEDSLKNVASKLGMKERKTKKEYNNKPNLQGKGLRNIVNGKIKVTDNSQNPDEFSLNQTEMDYISRMLSETYQKINSFHQ